MLVLILDVSMGTREPQAYWEKSLIPYCFKYKYKVLKNFALMRPSGVKYSFERFTVIEVIEI